MGKKGISLDHRFDQHLLLWVQIFQELNCFEGIQTSLVRLGVRLDVEPHWGAEGDDGVGEACEGTRESMHHT